jgi:hypothetical protein
MSEKESLVQFHVGHITDCLSSCDDDSEPDAYVISWEKVGKLTELLNAELSSLPALAALLDKARREAREEAFKEAVNKFEEVYSENDSPLIGVMYGLKAIRALGRK